MDSITVNIPSEDFTRMAHSLKDFADIQIHHDTDSRGEVIRTERSATPQSSIGAGKHGKPATLMLEEEGNWSLLRIVGNPNLTLKGPLFS
ncbi:MAG: hypothetical protein Ct9H90mP16_22140 [Candidatus Poseidoniales archaeon]|nr:MAG: hypothetical protein Ct9H90mP16_22140 [Candidatus Poseidoniales archaeon]